MDGKSIFVIYYINFTREVRNSIGVLRVHMYCREAENSGLHVPTYYSLLVVTRLARTS